MKRTKNFIIIAAVVALILITKTVEATSLIAKFEGLKLKAYQDSAGIWTIGYGTIINPETGLPIKEGDVITQSKALEWLKINTASTQTALKKIIKVPVNDREFAALTSLAYNIGTGAFSRSTLLRLLNNGGKRTDVADQFLRWNKVKGKTIKGLTLRRKLEKDLFLS